MLRSAERGGLILRRAFHPSADRQLEDDEGDEAEGGAGDVEQPEGRRRQARVEAADPSNDRVGDDETEIIKADHGGSDLPRRDLGKQRQADRQDVREANAVESSNIIGQNRLILPPAGCVSAPMNSDRPPAMVKTLPMIILLISSGSRCLRLHHFQKAATAISMETLTTASTVISQLLVLLSSVRSKCWSPQVEVSVEDFLIGEQRDRQHRDQDDEVKDAQPVTAR